MKLNDSNLFRQQALINGEWLDANNGEAIDVTNPANGDKLGSVPKMGADETRAAIDAANRALPAWRALTAKERATILRNWFIDHTHPRSPQIVSAITTPTQVASVSRLAIAQRASPVLMWPLNISATALINGKPGTSSRTLAAIAMVGVSLKVGSCKSNPEMVVAAKAVRQKLICG